MKYVRLGATGLKVSRLCLGCMSYGSSKWRPWILDEAAARPFFKTAIERGINFFDTADVYSQGESERVTGKLLKEFSPRRENYVLATKVYNEMGPGPNDRGLSRKHITEAVDASLRRLNTDYIDLYWIHRFDYETPVEETLQALSDVVASGKVLYLGASSMWAWQFAKLLGIQRAEGFAPFVAMQNFFNLIYREEEREMMPLCASEGIGVVPWSPLARGFLAGNAPAEGKGHKTLRAANDGYVAQLQLGSRQDYAIQGRVQAAAEKLGVNAAQVALAWVLSKPFITSPIIGATKPQQLDDAVAALDLNLDARTVKSLEEPYRPKDVVGHE